MWFESRQLLILWSFAGGLLARLIENSPDLPYVILDSTPCAPHPVVVEVPQPVDESTFYFPFFVTLYQCGGACNARPYDTACQPAGRSKELDVINSRNCHRYSFASWVVQHPRPQPTALPTLEGKAP